VARQTLVLAHQPSDQKQVHVLRDMCGHRVIAAAIELSDSAAFRAL
jgi:hypothetical protein